MKNYKQFHDGFFEGLWIPQKGTAKIYLGTITGERATVVLNGVVMLKATDFREGNISFDVTIRTAEEITLMDIAELYDLQQDRQPAAWEDQLLEKARKQGFQLFQISASYGGSCLALCATFEFTGNGRSAALDLI